ncbi:MAG: glycosyltransferase family 39 protein [Anaerolineales bacterium]|nr:glycosyltransferase family 39 protein [Anaerolineales bacterium]
MEEPSILDYIKSRLRPQKYPRVELPPEPEAPLAELARKPEPPQAEESPMEARRLPLKSITALLLALFAQASMGLGDSPFLMLGGVFLMLAAGALTWAAASGEWQAASPRPSAETLDPPLLNLFDLAAGLALLVIAFAAFGGLEFNPLNLGLLLAGLAFIVRAFWVSPPNAPTWQDRLRAMFRLPSWTITINLQTLAGCLAVAAILFFRFYRLGEVPPEMNSDHAEKILDVLRVLNGQRLIFFPTNGGREALIFYLNAALHLWFNIPLGFMLLKLTSALIGLAALPFLFGLGIELGGRRVAWLATLLAGVAYWPNVVSRFGLRLPFYFLFTAATLYYLARGLRTGKRNDFILAGAALGIGLYGYTPDRILPLVTVIAFGLYLLHHRSTTRLRFVVVSLLAVVAVSLALFLPMLRYGMAQPDAFLFRTLSRIGDVERPLEAPAAWIFLKNTWRALGMFSVDNGEIWPISIPHRPALGVIAGGLFYLGAAALLIRYIKRRNWLDLFLLISIPLLQIPSTLALAFPAENPNLYRAGGAMIPVFLMAGFALDGLINSIQAGTKTPEGARLAWALAVLLLGLAAVQDYQLVFDDYYQQYRMASWNSSEIGAIAKEFAETIGSPDTVWVMGYPHWVDTRLVALNAGFPGRDYELFVQELETTLPDTRAKLFILNKDDQAAADALRQMYPQGWLSFYPSKTPTKDFRLFFVPPQSSEPGSATD